MLQANDAIQHSAEVLSFLGSLRPIHSLHDRDSLVKDAVHYYVFGRIAPAVEQYVLCYYFLQKLKQNFSTTYHVLVFKQWTEFQTHFALYQSHHNVL